MNKMTWTIIAIVIILGGGAVLFAGKNREDKMQAKNSAEQNGQIMKEPEEKNGMMQQAPTSTEKTMDNAQEGAMMPKNEDGMPKNDKMMMEEKGSYIDYSPLALTNALKNNGKVLIFFHASWCPMCQRDDKSINENLNKIPAGLTILKTDYDKETELKTKYGITYQNTYVELDSDGTKLAQFNNGGQGINNILANLK